LPPTAFLGKEHAAALESEGVEFKQGNLTSAVSIEKMFDLGDDQFNYVFNLAAETKYSQTDEVYREKVFDLSVKCATEGAKRNVDRYVEMSTAQIYEPGKKASSENSTCKPWTGIGNYKLKAEESLRGINGLKLNIVRPAIVYGPGDVYGLSPRLICGAVYRHLGEKMKFLWGSDLRINTVHVRDVCKALWHIATRCPVGEVYNLVDKSDSSQGSINKHLEAIFKIKTSFMGGVVSNVAKLNMKVATEEINDKHLRPWSELCKKEEILNTPLTPYLDQELLYNNSLSVDGSKIESTGFSYDHPNVTEELVREQVNYYVSQNLFPAAVLK